MYFIVFYSQTPLVFSILGGGGVENVGVTRAVNEMLLSAPGGLYIELFPFFPPDEPASFTTLRSKGGWLVSAARPAQSPRPGLCSAHS